ncbi:MAG: nucleoside phosphorylase [Thermomicrobiales bacterium]
MTDARPELRPADAATGPLFFHAVPPERVGPYALVPGDPNRIRLMAKMWDDADEFDGDRGFRAAVGSYRGTPIAAFSSGIGGPSFEITLVDAARLGVNTFIRVGTTGALREEIVCGDLVINDASVRLDGTSRHYVRDEYPAAAAYEVTLALVEACERLGVRYHVGAGATAAAFFTGQGRPSFEGYFPAHAQSLISELQHARVLNLEMEAATLFTLARLFGLRAGAVCAVVANRVTGDWDEGTEGIERACRVASEAVRILAEWDRRVRAATKPRFFPGLPSSH